MTDLEIDVDGVPILGRLGSLEGSALDSSILPNARRQRRGGFTETEIRNPRGQPGFNTTQLREPIGGARVIPVDIGSRVAVVVSGAAAEDRGILGTERLALDAKRAQYEALSLRFQCAPAQPGVATATAPGATSVPAAGCSPVVPTWWLHTLGITGYRPAERNAGRGIAGGEIWDLRQLS